MVKELLLLFRDVRETIRFAGLADVYEGEMLNGLRHGQGTLFRMDGSQYEGSWKYGMKHGQGNLTHTDEVYERDWQNDERHVKGHYS